MAWLPKLLTSGSNPEYPLTVNTLRALSEMRALFTLGMRNRRRVWHLGR